MLAGGVELGTVEVGVGVGAEVIVSVGVPDAAGALTRNISPEVSLVTYRFSPLADHAMPHGRKQPGKKGPYWQMYFNGDIVEYTYQPCIGSHSC